VTILSMDSPIPTTTNHQELQELIVVELEAVVRSCGVTQETWPTLLGTKSFSAFVQPPKVTGFDGCLLCYSFCPEFQKPPLEVTELMHDALLKRNSPIFSRLVRGEGFIHYNIETTLLASAAFGEYMLPPRTDQKKKESQIIIQVDSPMHMGQHLGHLRNNCYAMSVARLLEYQGYQVTTVNLLLDRGIEISQAMLAFKRYGKSMSPPKPSSPLGAGLN
jgi:arginyl-tRNA synthetase